ncbi:hypothetical protein ACKAV7_013730 [Fusarium commune]
MFPTSGKTIPPPPPFKAPLESQYEKRASNGGRGTDDTLAVTRILEASDIPCCLVGISALIFYGAARVRPSCLDTRNETQLCDVIDGTNVSEEWGEENLDLEGFNDVEWAKDINKRGTEFENGRFAHWGPFAWDAPRSMRDMWQSLVRTKKDRLDWTKSSDVFITQYRIIDDPDPWTILSDDY